jgi:hypothetical protein
MQLFFFDKQKIVDDFTHGAGHKTSATPRKKQSRCFGPAPMGNV